MNETGTSELGKSQLDKFRKIVRELDADDGEVHSDEKMRKLVKHKHVSSGKGSDQSE